MLQRQAPRLDWVYYLSQVPRLLER